MEESKPAFRVPQSGLGRIECAVSYCGLDVGRSRVAAMDDLSMRIRFPKAGAPDLPLGGEVAVVVRVEGANALSPCARVRARSDSESARVYTLRLVHTERSRAKLLQSLIRAFNQRGALRVQPTADAPVDARLCAPDRTFERVLRIDDISASGASGSTDLEGEEVFCRLEDVRLSLVLERDGAPVQVDARIIGRELLGARVRYRFAFEERTAGQIHEVRKVTQYIMELQRSLVESGAVRDSLRV